MSKRSPSVLDDNAGVMNKPTLKFPTTTTGTPAALVKRALKKASAASGRSWSTIAAVTGRVRGWCWVSVTVRVSPNADWGLALRLASAERMLPMKAPTAVLSSRGAVKWR